MLAPARAPGAGLRPRAPQARTRLDAVSSTSVLRRTAICLQRVCLGGGAVQREDLMLAQPLAEGCSAISLDT